MKDIVTDVTPEEVRVIIQSSLEKAALLNYSQLSQKANIEGKIFFLFANS
jgi:calcium-dependent secretion activator